MSRTDVRNKAQRLIDSGAVSVREHEHLVATSYSVKGNEPDPHLVIIWWPEDMGLDVLCTCAHGTHRDPSGPACSHKLAAIAYEIADLGPAPDPIAMSVVTDWMVDHA